MASIVRSDQQSNASNGGRPSLGTPPVAEQRSSSALVRGAKLSLWVIAGLGLLTYLVLMLLYGASLMPFPFDYDQGEGFDVNSGLLFAQGKWIYNENSLYPYYSSNYTPVYSLLVAAGIMLFGTHLWVGRIVALLATLAAGAIVGLAVADETRDRVAAILSGLLFLASHYVYHIAPLARVNTLALAFALAGLYCVAKRQTSWIAAGMVFLFLAVYTKQTTLDAVGAALLFLVLWRWKQGLAWGTALGVSGIALALWINRQTGGQFYRNCIDGNVNDFDLGQTALFFGNFLGSHTLVVAAALLAIVLILRAKRATPWPIYFAAAIATAITVGKWGAGESYFLATIGSAAVLTGVAIAYFRQHHPRWVWVIPLLVLLQLRLFWHEPLNGLLPGWDDKGPQAEVLGHFVTPEDYTNGWRIARYLQETPYDVLAEEVGFNLAVGKRVVGNTTQIRNLHLAYMWDDRYLIEALENKEFGVVILNGQQYPLTVLDAIGRNYQEVETIPMNRFRYMVLLPAP